MKKLKLKKWVKVVLSLLILTFSIIVYSSLKTLGQNVNKSTLTDIYIIVGWLWLIVGQELLLYNIWED